MQLDRTRIAIRERGLWDVMDLSLRVFSQYARPILLSTAILSIPLFVFNWWITRWMVADEYSAATNWRYLRTMTQLVLLQAPVATLATTIFLGRVMFLQDVDAKSIARDLWFFTPRVIWTQLVVRGVLPGCVLAAMITRDVDVGPAEILLPFLCVYSLLLRSVRPFINEIVLLERNPLRARNNNSITVGRRSSSLHGPNSGDLFGRWIAIGIAYCGLTVCVSATLWFAVGVVTNEWTWGPALMHFCIPVAMWLVVAFSAVQRFLNYLDLRIRREGWEVELKVRAAATELKGQIA